MSTPMPPADPNDVLPAGTRVLWYEIERVLGRGGFAITYLAIDTNLRQPVALKEYLPMGLGQRGGDGVHAKPGNEKNFDWGRERFLAEAQTLARFKHRNIVRVVSFFEANNTAYLVMDFEEGQSLAHFMNAHPCPDAATLMAIIQPLMDGLEQLHRAAFIHRDIKPANIYLRRDGSPVLLDFGSARQAFGGQTQSLTSLLSPGYAPLEQYFSVKDRQGPWSDIYALAAVMYRGISGDTPPEASLRSSDVINGRPDPLRPARQAGLGRYPLHLLDAIDQGLRLREKDRPQSLAEWRTMMAAPTVAPETMAALDISVLNFAAETPPATAAPLRPAAALPTPQPVTPVPAAPAKPLPTRWSQRAPLPAEEPRRRGWMLPALLVGSIAAGVAYKLWRPAPVAPPPAAAASAAPASLPIAIEPQPPAERPRSPPRPAAPGPQQLDDKLHACKADAERYCPGIKPGDGRLAACLRDNLHRFSEECRPLLLGRLRPRPPRD